MTISKIDRHPLRSVWAHEATDFTTWLAANIDVVNEVINMNISVVERESAAGDFKLDLLAEDDSGRPVVIENQLERSDHDHLGKLMTYLANFDARAGIWIVAEPRPEHVAAIGWLNESAAADFYMLKAEAISIAGSDPALLLTQIAGPSAEQQVVGTEKKNITERHHLRRAFWTLLLDRAKSKTKLHAAISPSNSNWAGTTAGRKGIWLNYVIGQQWWRIELYIDTGHKGENEKYFDHLMESHDKIENRFANSLEWKRLDAKRTCKIQYQSESGGYKSPAADWPRISDEMVSCMILLDSALSGPIERLPRQDLSTGSNA